MRGAGANGGTRVVLFGDDFGVPLTVRCLPAGCIAAVVGAAIRPQYHAPLGEMAATLGVPFLVQPKAASEAYGAFVQAVARLEPDFIVVNSYSMKLQPDVLALPRRAAVNVHPAPLPRFRGSNPWQWALLNHERETAVTLHHMTADFDAGDIVAQEPVPILFDDTWLDIRARVEVATEALLARELPRLLDGTAARHPQDAEQARHWRRRTPEDGRIDWGESVLHIHDLVRGVVRPHPGAFYERDGERVVLDRYLSIPEIAALKHDAGGSTAGREVALEPLTAADLPAVQGWIDDPWQAPLPAALRRMDDARHAARFAELRRRNDLLAFRVAEGGGGEAVGWAQLRNLSWSAGTGEMHVHMDAVEDRGGGRHREVVELLLDFAFRELELRRVTAAVPRADAAALAVYEGLGFAHEGVLRGGALYDAAPADAAALSMVRQAHG